MQFVIFKLADEQFAVETSKVQTISDYMNITKVPLAPKYIKGLINLRGNVISVLDINMILNVAESKKGSESSIIILNMKDEQVGICIDQVDEVLDFDESVIEKSDEGTKKPYVKGIINNNGNIITIIDIDKLI